MFIFYKEFLIMCTLNIGSKKSHNNHSNIGQNLGSLKSLIKNLSNVTRMLILEARANCILKRRLSIPKFRNYYLDKYNARFNVMWSVLGKY